MIRTQELRGYNPVETIEGQGHNCERLTNAVAYNRKQDESDSAYLLTKIETTRVPTAQADYAVDKIELWCCNCASFQYQSLKPFLNGERTLDEISTCKHVKAHNKVERAENDDQQETLL